MPVIEVAERPCEAAAREHLLVEEIAVRVAEDGVRLGGHEPAAHAVDHAFAAPLAPVPVRWKRSMLSKSARKLPYPKPSSPQRWMTS